MLDLVYGAVGLERDGYGGSVVLNLIVISLLYFGCQYYAVEVLGKYYDVLIVSYVLLTILIFRYSFHASCGSRYIIRITLLFVNLVVSVVVSFIFFDKLGHDPLYKVIDYLGNHDSLFLRTVCFFVMITDVYIRVCFFRVLQKVVLFLMYIFIRLPLGSIKRKELLERRSTYSKRKEQEEKEMLDRIQGRVSIRWDKRQAEKKELERKNLQ